MVKDEPDGSLVRRVLSGEARSYAFLVDRYREPLGRYALRMLGNRDDAEDAVQDTFIRAYRSLHRCEGPDGFRPWVFGILVNRCRTHAARRTRTRALLTRPDLAPGSGEVASSELRDALRDALDRALAELAPEQREAFLLKHVEDLSYDMMETVTGVRSATLRMRVFRARDELRKLLAETIRD